MTRRHARAVTRHRCPRNGRRDRSERPWQVCSDPSSGWASGPLGKLQRAQKMIEEGRRPEAFPLLASAASSRALRRRSSSSRAAISKARAFRPAASRVRDGWSARPTRDISKRSRLLGGALRPRRPGGTAARQPGGRSAGQQRPRRPVVRVAGDRAVLGARRPPNRISNAPRSGRARPRPAARPKARRCWPTS